MHSTSPCPHFRGRQLGLTPRCLKPSLPHKQHPTKQHMPLSNVVAHALIRKIHGLYQRALRKYRGNVGLWLQFTTFCYLHGNQRLLSEVIAQALQLNPTCAGLWSFAAQWEYKRKVRLITSNCFKYTATRENAHPEYRRQTRRVMCPRHDTCLCGA